jgi:hypothetical protein
MSHSGHVTVEISSTQDNLKQAFSNLSLVGIATSYGLGQPGFISQGGEEIFFLHRNVQSDYPIQ